MLKMTLIVNYDKAFVIPHETPRDDLRRPTKGRPLRQLPELGYDRGKF